MHDQITDTTDMTDDPEALFPRSIRPLLWILLTVGAVAVLVFAAVAVVGIPRAGAAETIGTATLRLADGTTAGTVTFQQEPDALVTRVKVQLALSRSATGFHGIHLHTNSDPANGVDCVADPRSPSGTWFVSADGHWRRDVADAHPNHAGDLPSVWVNRDGTASVEFVIDRLQTGELFNRAVILHAGADNFANIPLGEAITQYRANATDATTATRNTGNAGDRLACGVVDVKR